MKYERPELIVLNAKTGQGVCMNGSGASLGSRSYYCTNGTTVEPNMCTDGAADTHALFQCDFGVVPEGPPACNAGGMPF